MSLRSKTQKAKKFGTPSAPSPTAQKSSPTSPRATGGTPSAPSPTAQKPSPASPRSYGITQTQTGQAIQEQFQTRLQKLVAPIRNTIRELETRAEYLKKVGWSGTPDMGARKTYEIVEKQKDEKLAEIKQIELEQHNIELQNNVNQIIQSIEGGNVLAPDYFQNNIAWVKSGTITQKEFLDTYYYLSNQGIIHSAPTEPIIEEPIIELPELLPEAAAQIEPIPIITPEINDSISTNMVTQQVINFNIINGRAVGSIKFVATDNFNPYYYGKNLINIIQIKDPNDTNILTTVKQNTLNFTETERDEIISYDEDIKQNTRATVESFVWEWMDKPAGAFSNMFSVKISETEPPKPVMTGFMGAGIAGAIAGLVLLGFIVDSKVGK